MKGCKLKIIGLVCLMWWIGAGIVYVEPLYARRIREDVVYQILGRRKIVQPEIDLLQTSLKDESKRAFVYRLLEIKELFITTLDFPEVFERLLIEVNMISDMLDPERNFLLPERILEHFYYSNNFEIKKKFAEILFRIFTETTVDNFNNFPTITIPKEQIQTPKIFVLAITPVLDFLVDIRSVGQRKEYQVNFGERGINVVRGLRNLGIVSTPFGFIGGVVGNFGIQFLNALQISSDYMIPINGELDQITILHSRDPQIFLNPREVKIEKSEQDMLYGKLSDILNGADILVISSFNFPEGLPDDFYARIVTEAKAKGVKVILDLVGKPFLEGIKSGPFAIAPNLEEFAELVETDLDELREDIEKIVLEARDLIESTETEVIIVKLGSEGALLVTKDSAFLANPPELKSEDIKSTVGGGDAFLTGFIYAHFIQSLDLKESLRFAVAAGTAKVLLPFISLPVLTEIQGILDQGVDVKEIEIN